jgi:hypothetical protein
MRSMQWQLGKLGTTSASAFRPRETKKNLCRGGVFSASFALNTPCELRAIYYRYWHKNKRTV